MAKNASLDLPQVRGLITSDAMYTLDEIRDRLKLGQSAMRQARRAGLKVRRIRRRGYVLGRDLLAYVESEACQ